MPLDIVSTSARSELRRLLDEIAAAQQDRARAQEAVDRLERPNAEVLATRAERAAEKAAYAEKPSVSNGHADIIRLLRWVTVRLAGRRDKPAGRAETDQYKRHDGR